MNSIHRFGSRLNLEAYVFIFMYTPAVYVQYTVYIVICTVYSVYCVMYIVQCILYTHTRRSS